MASKQVQLGTAANGILATAVQVIAAADAALPALGDAEYIALMGLISRAAQQRADARQAEAEQDDGDALAVAAGIPTTPWAIPATRAAIKAVSLDLAAEA